MKKRGEVVVYIGRKEFNSFMNLTPQRKAHQNKLENEKNQASPPLTFLKESYLNLFFKKLFTYYINVLFILKLKFKTFEINFL